MLLDRTKIPTDITTVEELSLWCELVLNYTMSGTQYKERAANAVSGDTGFQEIAEVTQFRAVDETPRLISRLAHEMQPDYTSPSYNGRLWNAVKEWCPGTLPTSFAQA